MSQTLAVLCVELMMPMAHLSDDQVLDKIRHVLILFVQDNTVIRNSESIIDTLLSIVPDYEIESPIRVKRRLAFDERDGHERTPNNSETRRSGSVSDEYSSFEDEATTSEDEESELELDCGDQNNAETTEGAFKSEHTHYTQVLTGSSSSSDSSSNMEHLEELSEAGQIYSDSEIDYREFDTVSNSPTVKSLTNNNVLFHSPVLRTLR